MPNPITFHNWLTSARRGDTHTYYIGNLAVERGDCALSPQLQQSPALEEAGAAWRAAEAGLVALVQRAVRPRLPNGTHPAFHYIAQRTSRVF